MEKSSDAVRQLELALTRNDFDTIRHIAHTIKSSSASVGATAFSSLCRKIEAQAGDRVQEAIGATVAKLGKEFIRVEEALKTIMDKTDNKIAS